jgi:hypothetical protein
VRCYSDHNEDVRTKGACDLCGDVDPEPHDSVDDGVTVDDEGSLVCLVCGLSIGDAVHAPI